MVSAINKLRETFRLQITSPFSLQVEGKLYEFQCLILGYGAEKGMIVDKDWGKIASISNKLVAMGFGYSCFDIENADIGGFQEILDDWGVSNLS